VRRILGKRKRGYKRLEKAELRGKKLFISLPE
jgi:hypothetical protein